MIATPPGRSPGEDLALGVRDGGERGEMLDVDRLDRGDQRDVGPDLGGERHDLGRVVHADLEHAVAAVEPGIRARVSGTPQWLL